MQRSLQRKAYNASSCDAQTSLPYRCHPGSVEYFWHHWSASEGIPSYPSRNVGAYGGLMSVDTGLACRVLLLHVGLAVQ